MIGRRTAGRRGVAGRAARSRCAAPAPPRRRRRGRDRRPRATRSPTAQRRPTPPARYTDAENHLEALEVEIEGLRARDRRPTRDGAALKAIARERAVAAYKRRGVDPRPVFARPTRSTACRREKLLEQTNARDDAAIGRLDVLTEPIADAERTSSETSVRRSVRSRSAPVGADRAREAAPAARSRRSSGVRGAAPPRGGGAARSASARCSPRSRAQQQAATVHGRRVRRDRTRLPDPRAGELRRLVGRAPRPTRVRTRAST